MLTVNKYEMQLDKSAFLIRRLIALHFRNLTLETPVYTKLDHICLEVKRGECFAFLGAHGAGKSTFLKTLYGYHNFPTFGDVELHGLSLIRDYDEVNTFLLSD